MSRPPTSHWRRRPAWPLSCRGSVFLGYFLALALAGAVIGLVATTPGG